ncbi:MAG: GntR family transcriptional regulator [Rhodoferax sp.]
MCTQYDSLYDHDLRKYPYSRMNESRTARNRGGRRTRPMSGLSDRMRETIEEEIATRTLPPGSRQDEAEIALRFKVSRTPIREALSLLLAGLDRSGTSTRRHRRPCHASAVDRNVLSDGRVGGHVRAVGSSANVRARVRRHRDRACRGAAEAPDAPFRADRPLAKPLQAPANAPRNVVRAHWLQRRQGPSTKARKSHRLRWLPCRIRHG